MTSKPSNRSFSRTLLYVKPGSRTWPAIPIRLTISVGPRNSRTRRAWSTEKRWVRTRTSTSSSSEQSYNLLRKGGRCGIITPGGIYADLGAKRLREMLLFEGKVDRLFGLSNERLIFDAVH